MGLIRLLDITSSKAAYHDFVGFHLRYEVGIT